MSNKTKASANLLIESINHSLLQNGVTKDNVDSIREELETKIIACAIHAGKVDSPNLVYYQWLDQFAAQHNFDYN